MFYKKTAETNNQKHINIFDIVLTLVDNTLLMTEVIELEIQVYTRTHKHILNSVSYMVLTIIL